MNELYDTKKPLTFDEQVFWLQVETILRLTLCHEDYHTDEDYEVPKGKHRFTYWLINWINNVHSRDGFDYSYKNGVVDTAWTVYKIMVSNENEDTWNLHPGYEHEYWESRKLEWRLKHSYMLLCILENESYVRSWLSKGDCDEARFKAWHHPSETYHHKNCCNPNLERADRAVNESHESKFHGPVSQRLKDEWSKTKEFLLGVQ